MEENSDVALSNTDSKRRKSAFETTELKTKSKEESKQNKAKYHAEKLKKRLEEKLNDESNTYEDNNKENYEREKKRSKSLALPLAINSLPTEEVKRGRGRPPKYKPIVAEDQQALQNTALLLPLLELIQSQAQSLQAAQNNNQNNEQDGNTEEEEDEKITEHVEDNQLKQEAQETFSSIDKGIQSGKYLFMLFIIRIL